MIGRVGRVAREQILDVRRGQRAGGIHGDHRLVDAVVLRDAIEVPLRHLRDGVLVRGVERFEPWNADVAEIVVDARHRRESGGQHGQRESGQDAAHAGIISRFLLPLSLQAECGPVVGVGPAGVVQERQLRLA